MATPEDKARDAGPPKVIAVGMLRTGTTSVRRALEELGFQHVYDGLDSRTKPSHWVFFEKAAAATWPEINAVGQSPRPKPFTREDWDELFGVYDALTDLVCFFALELADAYPDAKIILTERDYDKWFPSFDSQVMQAVFGPGRLLLFKAIAVIIGNRAGFAMEKLFRGLYGGAYSLDEMHRLSPEMYRRHSERIKAHIAPERLLVYRVGRDGWKPLCDFLGKEVPEGKEFPFANDRESHEKSNAAIQPIVNTCEVTSELPTMQSGISASEELVSQFNTLLSTDDHFGLLVTIDSETLKPVQFLSKSSSSFDDNISALQPHLKPNEALYALLRRYDTAPHLTAITYIPDSAKVRQKMLFASTRLTLVRKLGSEHFRESIFSTTPEELSAQGFAKHDAHTELEAPLTEEERSLGAVKQAEAEASTGTGSREIHLSKTLAMPIAEDALAAMKELNEGRVLVMLKINPDKESVELVPSSESPSSISELTQTISATEPRFTLYRFTHTHNGAESSPLLFIYTCPVTPGNKAIKNRMLYPLMKRAVLEIATGEAGLTLDKKLEVEEPSEVTEESVLSELHPKVTARAGFSRPKRPGR
ncbi:cofilin tropomyosin-type actin-binding protein [Colletotrichum karsti]|uniref:Twinfilin n=1 Tax=Colletotrichum karsti TaxID=1095194 RepID=A0A9P6IAV3_9PEZI|nr:cofilin tropomyosin-type actin-binding protein [Colletotrichum karsti]KAF9875245.1 cofilin tropomyosin-type actin-binding protein [Colletotrichum karsti]